jgi:GTP-binding protein
VLLHLVDLTASDPIADFHTIRAELDAYGHGLADRPQIVALNKVDAAGLEGIGDSGQTTEEIAQALQPYTDYPVFVVSAVSRTGLDALLQQVWQVLEAAEPVEEPSELPSLS